MGACMPVIGKVLFRIGQFILMVGICCYVVAVATTNWVVRPEVDYMKENIDPNTTLVTKNYGIFLACKQSLGSGRGDCGSLWENLNFINDHTARYIQAVMVVAGILYFIGVSLEVVQFLPIRKFRNFIAKNRMVEMFSGIATVLVLQGMIIFAGEIKNKAEKVPGQEEEQSGWSFIVGLLGLILCVIGLLLVTMFRDLPINKPGKIGGSWLREPSTTSC